MRFVLIVVLGAALLGVLTVTGLAQGTPNDPPPDVGGEVRCTTYQPIAAAGTPGDNPAQRLARRMRRFCDAMNGTPPPGMPPGQVTAREVCLDMQHRGQLLPADDCTRIPPDQTYPHH